MSFPTPPRVDLAVLSRRAGRLAGRGTRCGRLCLDRRCASFPLIVTGAEHLHLLQEQSCLLVANHVLIRAEDAPLGVWTQARALSLLNQPPDSFLLRRVVREQTGRPLHVVAKSDRGWWSPRPWVRCLQKRIGQPFGKGLLEGMEFIPVEHNPDCFHRTFFQSAAEPVRRGLPLLIFPGRLRHDPDGCHDPLAEHGQTAACLLPGAAHLARKFGLPIIPLFIQGGDTWRPEKPTCIFIGPAFRTESMTKAAINRQIIEQMQALLPAPLLGLPPEPPIPLPAHCAKLDPKPFDCQ